MKTSIGKLVLILSVMIATTVSAKVNLEKYEAVAKDIVTLEASQKYEMAALKSAEAANEIAAQLGFDQVVQQISTTLDLQQKEVVVETKNKHGGLSLLGALLSASFSSKNNVTKIITTNPQDLFSFSFDKRSDFERLQDDLVDYVKTNEAAIIYAKGFAAKAILLMTKLDVDSMKDIYDYTLETAQKVSNINFIGEQDVVECTTIHHPRLTSKLGFNISSFLISLNYGSVNTKKAYAETSCEGNLRSISLNEESVLAIDNLTMIDRILRNAEKDLAIKLVIESKAPEYPMWGMLD